MTINYIPLRKSRKVHVQYRDPSGQLVSEIVPESTWNIWKPQFEALGIVCQQPISEKPSQNL